MKAFAGLGPLLLAGCAPAAVDAPLPVGGPTIVSLNPCTDAVLAQVAEPSQLLAISHYSHDPAASSMDVAKARRFRSTGGTVEEVLALDPDVVVAGSFLPPATRAAFEDLGVRVETFGMATSVDESIAQVERLGAIAGRQAEAQELARSIANAATPDQSGDTLSAVLWQPGGIVPGEATLVSDLMRRAGYTSHSAASGLGQADYLSLEALLADPPEVLLVAGRERSQAHPSLAALNEMRTERFDGSLLYCGGPTIIRAMDRLRAIKRVAA